VYVINLFKNRGVFSAKQDWNFKTKSIKKINTERFDNINSFSSLQTEHYCRRQISFNLGDWWIMLLHHIGLPPAINLNPELPVSGNIYNYTYKSYKEDKQ